MLFMNLMNLEFPSKRESRGTGFSPGRIRQMSLMRNRLSNQNTQAEDTSEPSTRVATMSQDYVFVPHVLLFPHPSKFLFPLYS